MVDREPEGQGRGEELVLRVHPSATFLLRVFPRLQGEWGAHGHLAYSGVFISLPGPRRCLFQGARVGPELESGVTGGRAQQAGGRG